MGAEDPALNRYPRPLKFDFEKMLADERAAHSITRKELAAAYGELVEAREPKQLDVEIEALKKQLAQALAAIEFALFMDDHTGHPDAGIDWLRSFVEEKPEAIAELERFMAACG